MEARGLGDSSGNSYYDDCPIGKQSLAPGGPSLKTPRRLRACPHPTQRACPVHTGKGRKDMEGSAPAHTPSPGRLSGQRLAGQNTLNSHPPPPTPLWAIQAASCRVLDGEWDHRVLNVYCVPSN